MYGLLCILEDLFGSSAEAGMRLTSGQDSGTLKTSSKLH